MYPSVRVRLLHRQHTGVSGGFMTRGYLTERRLRTPALGVHQYTYQYQGTVFYFRCEHCVNRKVTVFLQYFCHTVLHSSCCGGYCSLLPLFSTKELINFLLFYFIFGCLV